MVTGLVNDYKSNGKSFAERDLLRGKIVDYTNPQVRKEINEQTAEQQITKAREYAMSKSKNI